LGLRAAAGQEEANGVVELDGGGAEIRARRWSGAYRRKEKGGEVAPVEVRPRGVAGERQWGTGNFLGGCGGQWEARGGGSAATSSSPAKRKEAAVGFELWANGGRASEWNRRSGS
jgi:hypothetical protein